LLLSTLGQFKLRLENLLPHTSDDGKVQINDMIDEFESAQTGFSELLTMTSSLSVDQKDATPKPLSLAQRLEKTVRCFRLIRTNYKIKIETDGVPRNLKAGPLLEAELFSIFLNVLSNSIKSVIARGSPRRISISASVRDGKKAVLSIKDTGLGMAAGNTDVFKAFIADPDGELYDALRRQLNPEDKYIIGTGSGLGLSILQEIVSSRGGSITFVDAKKPWTANLEIELPWQKNQ